MTLKLSRPAPPIEPATTRPELTPTPIRSRSGVAVVRRLRHLHRRPQRPVGVVGVRLGSAEDRQKPVADELVDVAAVAGDDGTTASKSSFSHATTSWARRPAAKPVKSRTSQNSSETSSSLPSA